MFTLFPYESSAQTAKILDDTDLTDQIRCVKIIMDTLHQVNDISGWDGTPGVLMWEDYEPQLCVHGLALCQEYKTRTGQTSVLEASIDWHLNCATSGSFTMRRPGWTVDPVLHLAHQSHMVRKNHNYQSVFPVGPDLEMIWPVKKDG